MSRLWQSCVVPLRGEICSVDGTQAGGEVVARARDLACGESICAVRCGRTAGRTASARNLIVARGDVVEDAGSLRGRVCLHRGITTVALRFGQSVEDVINLTLQGAVFLLEKGENPGQGWSGKGSAADERKADCFLLAVDLARCAAEAGAVHGLVVSRRCG